MTDLRSLSPFGLAGKTAIVTGAASGIGRATATLFAQVGARVVFADLDEAGVRAAAHAVGADHAVCDISDETQVKACSNMPPDRSAGGWTCSPMSPLTAGRRT